MENIKFEVDQSPRMNLSTTKESALAKWIVKLGITDNITTANYILVGITALFIGITIFIYARILFSNPKQTPSSAEEEQMMDNAPIPLN